MFDVAVCEYVRIFNGIIVVGEDVVKGGMSLIVFPAFDFYRVDSFIHADDEIEFALFLGMEMVRDDAMRCEFLRNGILVDGTDVERLLSVEDFELLDSSPSPLLLPRMPFVAPGME